MLSQLREQIGISFKDLEQSLWVGMIGAFGSELAVILEAIDEELFRLRDRKRYTVKDIKSRNLVSLLGVGIEFKRRRYYDMEKQKDVYLLDEVLDLVPYQRTSPGLKEAMVIQAVVTSSYRKAAESITRLLGFTAVSHESIRQAVIEVGSALEEVGKEQRENPQGKKEVDVLFLEADGLDLSLQQEKKRSIEEKVLTTHEGWKPRHPGGQEYSLVQVEQYRSTESDFWDAASRHVYAHYDITEETLVVLNGDRASWIRKGIDYFPNALYQVDRFHLKRDLKRIFGAKGKELKELFQALDGQDATGATFLGKLAEASSKLVDKERRESAQSLIKDLAEIAEATVDYRVRMKARGLSTKGLRGLGAAESQNDRLSDRMKGRGRSWRPKGEGAMMELLCARNANRFEAIIEGIDTWCQRKFNTAISIKDAVKRAVSSVVYSRQNVPVAKTPIDSVGTNASGGLSSLFHRLNESGMPIN